MGNSPTLDQRDSRWRQDGAGQAYQQVAEAAFDRLNPDFGVPADHTTRTGHHATHQREWGLALGTRVAVAASRETTPPRS